MIPLKLRRFWQIKRPFAVGILVCLCALSFAVDGCKGNASRATQPTSAQPEVASSDAVEAIDATIAVSMAGSQFPYRLSDRLQLLTKKYVPEPVFGFTTAGTTFVKEVNGVAIELTPDWSAPVNFAGAKLPLVKFRKGEIGIIDTEIYVKEGTEALVGEKAYVFANKQWTRQVDSK